MEITAELIQAALAALSAFFAGGGLSFAFWKRRAGQAVSNLTPADVLNIAFEMTRTTQANSPGGQEITQAEAEALGRAVWQATRPK